MGHVFFAGGFVGEQSRLPKGYTELAYIQSSGTQWIDTGFKPNQNTRVVCDFQLVSTSGWQTIFGAWTLSGSSYINGFVFLSSGSYFRSTNGSAHTAFSSSLDRALRWTVDKNKTACTLSDGSAITHTSTTFAADENMYLFAGNTDGSASEKASVKIYSCQIYDNGTLVRDFVPCVSDADGVGLFDLVNNQFYGNAGSGSFVGSEVA